MCSRLTAHHDAGVPARGLNGEAYRGHVFWDELFVYPFLNFRLPGDHARAADVPLPADRRGPRGGRGGRLPRSDVSVAERQRRQEETQIVHLNPLSGRWDPDLSHNQRHVNAAIFYNIWQYYQATDDVDFLRDYGAEMMLEIARFWSSIAHFNPNGERWEIHGVMGPDEFHERYPGTAEGGLRNNAYTNVMVAWICQTAGKVLELLPATPARGAARRSRPHRRGDPRMGADEPPDVRPVPRGRHHQPVRGLRGSRGARLGRYRAEAREHPAPRPDPAGRGRRPDRYKLAKQADTVMLFFLFTDEQLRVLFERLGYQYAADTPAGRSITTTDGPRTGPR